LHIELQQLFPLRNKEEIMEDTKVTVAEAEAPKKRGRKAKASEAEAPAAAPTPKTEKKAPAEKKASAEKKVSAKKAASTEEKDTEKKAVTAKKPAAKKTAAKKKETEVQASVFIEYAGRQIIAKDVLEAAKKAYTDAHEGAAIESIEVYVNTEESCAYYVVNGEPVEDKIEL
jgi:pyruvate/2-oxoglutarate dehydrogenase complex dihydrolipoamide acyltransferase (E2) component